MSELDPAVVLRVRRQLRLVAILSAAREAGLDPLPARQLHAVAYFADALAPVWGLRILDTQLLKQREGPTSPILQRDVDLLVGRGILVAASVRHVEDADGNWRLDAHYTLNDKFVNPILDAANKLELTELPYVREVVFAMSGLGLLGIARASALDASYGSELVDIGGMVDIGSDPSSLNDTARVAMRFGVLMESQVKLSAAEEVHLYVLELYKRISYAA